MLLEPIGEIRDRLRQMSRQRLSDQTGIVYSMHVEEVSIQRAVTDDELCARCDVPFLGDGCSG